MGAPLSLSGGGVRVEGGGEARPPLVRPCYPGTILTVFFFIFCEFFNLNCAFSKIDNLQGISFFFCLLNTCVY